MACHGAGFQRPVPLCRSKSRYQRGKSPRGKKGADECRSPMPGNGAPACDRNRSRSIHRVWRCSMTAERRRPFPGTITEQDLEARTGTVRIMTLRQHLRSRLATPAGFEPATNRLAYHFGFRRRPEALRGLDCPFTLPQ